MWEPSPAGTPFRPYFKDAADGVSGAISDVNRFFHAGFALGIDAAEQDFLLLGQHHDLFPGDGTLQADGPDGDHMRENLDVELTEEELCQGSHCNASRRLPGAGTFQNIAGIRGSCT